MGHRLIPSISRSAAQSFLAIIALAGLTTVCFRLQLNISTVGFLYLIVIVLLSLAGDYVASVVASVVAAVCLAYFFAPPIFSIRVEDPLNIAAIIAFLTTSLVISRLVSEVRTKSEKLRLNEDYLSEGQRLAHMGSWAFDAAGFSYWSSGLFRVYGLDQGRKPPTVEEYLALVHPEDRAFMKQGEIIDRIRSFYKKSPPQRELVDVNGIIHEILMLLEGEAFRLSVAMRTDLSAELPKIMLDRVQLQQVFMNLMLNAIEAMKDSGGELTVRSQLQDSQLLVSVSDTGVGLPTEKVEQIFSAFFTTKTQGSGMGLAISRSIVESHGGRLWAAANDGRGATFYFTMPTAAETLQVPATGT